jgi:hypothetical protein
MAPSFFRFGLLIFLNIVLDVAAAMEMDIITKICGISGDTFTERLRVDPLFSVSLCRRMKESSQ